MGICDIRGNVNWNFVILTVCKNIGVVFVELLLYCTNYFTQFYTHKKKKKKEGITKIATSSRNMIEIMILFVFSVVQNCIK